MNIPNKNVKVKISEKANVKETAEIMGKMISIESKKPYIKEIAKKLCISKEAPNTSAMLLCNFAFHTATFEPDVNGVQVIKTPAATIRTKKGNCVDYTVLIGSIAKAVGIPVIIKVVAIGDQAEFGHVYPIVNGLSCDVVPYQRQDGKEHLFRTGQEVVYPIEKEYNKFFLVEI
jgi:transglutaminase-like putative cysteine protease